MSDHAFATELRHQLSITHGKRLLALQDGDLDTAELALGRLADLLEIADRNDLVDLALGDAYGPLSEPSERLREAHRVLAVDGGTGKNATGPLHQPCGMGSATI